MLLSAAPQTVSIEGFPEGSTRALSAEKSEQ